MIENLAMKLDETKELRILAEDAKMMNDLGITSYLADLAEQKEQSLKDPVNKVSLQIVGRIFKPKVFQGILFEVHKYDGRTGDVILRRLFDQNQILLAKKNVIDQNIKRMRGTVLF
jgi:hypothetical protein